VRRAAILLWLAAATPAHADETRAFVELVTERDSFYVGEPVRLTLRVGYDAEYFKKFAVQLFQQRLDVPVQVEALGSMAIPGAVPRPMVRSGDVTISLDDGVAWAAVAESQLRNGRTFKMLTVERTYTVGAPGERTIPAPILRFASGTRFREDFLHGRVATDRRDTVVKGEPLTIRILAIPEEGRPAGWAGAVGQLALRTAVSTREFDEGEHFELTIHMEGECNLRMLPRPALADMGLSGFHVYGTLEEYRPGIRTIKYEVASLQPDIDEIPALALPYFDPTPPAQYRFARSEPIPVKVRAKASTDTATNESYVEAWIFPGWAIALSVTAVLALALVAWRVARRAEASPSTALLQFETKAASNLADALPDYLAAHLGCTRAAVISPDLRERLRNSNVPDELAARTARIVEDLVGARYGGHAAEDRVVKETHGLVAALESVFHPSPT